MEITVTDYSPLYKKDFERLNREWLEKYFRVEPIDVEYFNDPEGLIIKKGGFIFFAKLGEEVVGTCALLKHPDHWELAKMGVTEKYRGLGISNKLMDAAIQKARDMGAKEIELITNSTLIPAIKLYEKYGFVITFQGQDPLYERGDLGMKLVL